LDSVSGGLYSGTVFGKATAAALVTIFLALFGLAVALGFVGLRILRARF
jgi:hypothetical protein